MDCRYELPRYFYIRCSHIYTYLLPNLFLNYFFDVIDK